MISTLRLPDVTTIKVENSKGETVFEDEAIYLDEMLAEAQEGIDVNKSRAWIPKFQQLINAKHSCNLSETHAFVIACKTSNVVSDLKKTAAFNPESQTSMESIPSNSQLAS